MHGPNPVTTIVLLGLLACAHFSAAQPVASKSCDAELQGQYRQCTSDAVAKCGTNCCKAYQAPAAQTQECQTELSEKVFRPCVLSTISNFSAGNFALVAKSAGGAASGGSTGGGCYYPATQLDSPSDQLAGVVMYSAAKGAYAFGGSLFANLTCDSDLCAALGRAGGTFSGLCGSCQQNVGPITAALGILSSATPGTAIPPSAVVQAPATATGTPLSGPSPAPVRSAGPSQGPAGPPDASPRIAVAEPAAGTPTPKLAPASLASSTLAPPPKLAPAPLASSAIAPTPKLGPAPIASSTVAPSPKLGPAVGPPPFGAQSNANDPSPGIFSALAAKPPSPALPESSLSSPSIAPTSSAIPRPGVLPTPAEKTPSPAISAREPGSGPSPALGGPSLESLSPAVTAQIKASPTFGAPVSALLARPPVAPPSPASAASTVVSPVLPLAKPPSIAPSQLSKPSPLAPLRDSAGVIPAKLPSPAAAVSPAKPPAAAAAKVPAPLIAALLRTGPATALGAPAVAAASSDSPAEAITRSLTPGLAPTVPAGGAPGQGASPSAAASGGANTTGAAAVAVQFVYTGTAKALAGMTLLEDQDGYISVNSSSATGAALPAIAEMYGFNSTCSMDLLVASNDSLAMQLVNSRTGRAVAGGACRSNATSRCSITGVPLEPAGDYVLFGTTAGSENIVTYRFNATFYTTGCVTSSATNSSATAPRPSSTAWQNYLEPYRPGVNRPFIAALPVNASCLAYDIGGIGLGPDFESMAMPFRGLVMTAANFAAWQRIDRFAADRASPYAIPNASCSSNPATGSCRNIATGLDPTQLCVLVVIDGPNGLTADNLGLLDVYYRVAPRGGSCVV